MKNQKFKLSIIAAMLSMSVGAQADTFNFVDVSVGTTMNSSSTAGVAGGLVAGAVTSSPAGGMVSNSTTSPLGGLVAPATGAVGAGAAGAAGAMVDNTQSSSNTSIKFMMGVGQNLIQNVSGGVSAGFLMAKGYQMPIVQADMFIFNNQMAVLNPHIGYSVRTGGQAGVDVLFVLSKLIEGADKHTALRIGMTKFQKAEIGAEGTFQIGLTHLF